jgi:hypothetical protein
MIVSEGALEEGGAGTAADRLGDRHTGAHPEFPRPVRGRLDHAPLVATTPDDQELEIAQLGMALATDLDKEGVQVHMEEAGRHECEIKPGFGRSTRREFKTLQAQFVRADL